MTDTPALFASVPPTPATMVTASARLNITGDKPVIAMIVDDHLMTAQLLCETLVDSGISTVYTTSSNEAIALALRTRPRVILLDLLVQQLQNIGAWQTLPDIEKEFISWNFWGAILLRQMQQIPELAGTVLMLMSCLRPRLEGMGNIPFIPKPFTDINGIVRTVRLSAGLARE